VIAAILLAPWLSFASPVQASAPATYYVEPTGHSLSDPFLAYWIEHDGRTTLGNPVTEAVSWEEGVAQFFEFGVLTTDRSGDVDRISAGRQLFELRHAPDILLGTDRRTGSDPRPGGYLSPLVELSVTEHAAEPSYAIDDDLEPFYATLGARDFFGKALSNAVRSGNRTVQWFEFARIELSSGQPRLAPVGAELATRLGLDTTPVERDGAPLFDPNRYQQFYGDGTIPNANGAFIPTRITIPKIRVNAVIESIGVTNGVMDTPRSAWNVGWYASMASPGEWTNVVMSGHRDWYNIGPVVFWNLSLLAPGDKIYVTGPDGSGATYVVMTGWMIGADEPADGLIADTGFEALTLITCGGRWDGREYTHRYVVRAKRI
jgi:LPXTG-site transpeptidase (sortase) family protein